MSGVRSDALGNRVAESIERSTSTSRVLDAKTADVTASSDATQASRVPQSPASRTAPDAAQTSGRASGAGDLCSFRDERLRGFQAALAHFFDVALDEYGWDHFKRKLISDELCEDETHGERAYRIGWNACRSAIASALGVTL